MQQRKQIEDILSNFQKKWCSGNSGRYYPIPIEISALDEIIKLSIKKSYFPAVNRALKTNNKSTAKSRLEASTYLYDQFSNLLEQSKENNYSRKDFIDWEKNTASDLRSIFHKNGLTDFTFGNSQKWINVCIKYLLSTPNIDTNAQINLLTHAFFPIDRIVMSIAKKELKVKPLNVSWSKCDSLEDIVKYQNSLHNTAIENEYCSGLHWEIENWKRNV